MAPPRAPAQPPLPADFGDWALDESCLAIARSPGIKATECVESFAASELEQGAVAVAFHVSSDGPMGARLRVVLERPPSARSVALGSVRPPYGCDADVTFGESGESRRTTGGTWRLYFDRERWDREEPPKTRPAWLVGEYRVEVWSGELLAADDFTVSD